MDGSGAAYVTGATDSIDFPTTPGAFDRNSNGYYDSFVAKLNPSGSALTYATFLGGSGDDKGNDITVDGSGAAYVTGETDSINFPTTPGVFDTSLSGSPDAFVVNFDPSGSALSYATFLGGSGYDWGYGIAVDGSGAAYVTGETRSTDFPTTLGAFDRSSRRWRHPGDTFAVSYSAPARLWPMAPSWAGPTPSMTFPWTGRGGFYVTGETDSINFPTTPGAFDRSYGGGSRCLPDQVESLRFGFGLGFLSGMATTMATASRWTGAGRPTSRAGPNPPTSPPRRAPSTGTTAATTTPSWLS